MVLTWRSLSSLSCSSTYVWKDEKFAPWKPPSPISAAGPSGYEELRSRSPLAPWVQVVHRLSPASWVVVPPRDISDCMWTRPLLEAELSAAAAA